ncbi:MAG: cadherin-like beta sandwich domain-containing protein [Burkholderiaceae bacterium]
MTNRISRAVPALQSAASPSRRRHALGALSGLGLLSLAACGAGGADGGTSSSGSGDTSSSGSGGTSSDQTSVDSTSNAAALTGLTVSAGTLSPAFSSSTTRYTMTVSNSIALLTLTPIASSGTASITVNGTAVASGSASGAISLAVGDNTLTVVVASSTGASTTYTLLVTRSAAGACTLTLTETDGPYPLYAVLSNASIRRSDVTEGKTGVPLTLTITLEDLSAGCTPIAGAAIYIWHCDKDGLYSGYDIRNNAGQAGLTYLRGVQVTDAAGQASFTTIYPGWYAGRITHIHMQVYVNNSLTGTATATTQFAFPQEVTQAVYASSLYTKGQNTSITSFSADNVFSDGTSTEMLTISGDVNAGYSASITVVIA